MIHVFDYKDAHYIYDTGSGSLHECDKDTADYLKAKYEGGTMPKLSAKKTREIEADIKSLQDGGLLLCPEVKTAPIKSDEVKALCLHICHDCNLRCRYCFADEGAYHAERAFMSERTAKTAIDFLIKNSGNRKVLEVDFFGGEPLMCLDTIKNVVAYAREEGAKAGKKFLFTTTTNALSRGDKNYYVRGTFTARNLDFSKDVLFLAENGFDSISMEPVVTEIDDLAIKEEHIPEILSEYETLCDRYLEKHEKGEGFNFFHFNVDLEGGVCLHKKVSACGAGNEYFSVVPNGDIYPCHQFAGEKEFLMGNVYEGKLDPAIREKFASNSLFTRKGCENCFAKFICSGGCSANNYHYTGDMNTPYPITCDMMKKRIECGMHVLARKKSGQK